MAFLREKDYYSIIAQDDLEQILEQARTISGDVGVRQQAEVTSIARIKECLIQRFKVNKIFNDLLTFNITSSYIWNNVVDFTAPAFDPTIVYTSQTVVYNTGTIAAPINQVFLKNAETSGYVAGILPTNLTYFSYVGDESLYFITPPADWDEDTVYPPTTSIVTYQYDYYIRTADVNGYGASAGPDAASGINIYEQWGDIGFPFWQQNNQGKSTDLYGAGTDPSNSTYWTKILDFTPYLVTGTWPNDSTKWTKGDARPASLVKIMVDLTLYLLHSIVTPNQVPRIRDDRYKAAEEWLKDAGKGNITPDLPWYTEDKQKGFSLRFGNSESQRYSY